MWDRITDGDVLIFWRMPWLTSRAIDAVSDSQPVHHCSVALDGREYLDTGGPNVFEAWQPRVRSVLLADYRKIVERWASNWRYLVWPKPMLLEVWRRPGLLASDAHIMLREALAWLGVPYSMLTNWLYKGPKIHCSEYVARILIAAGLVDRRDAVDRRGQAKEPSRWTPWDVRNAMWGRNWKLVESWEP